MFVVGIAEQHAVTFAAGMAASGLIPVVAIYSSFLQRAYDQILHDVCLQKLHVIFAIDRSGLVGQDGETHQGIYDISYLSHMPNMVVLAPKNRYELTQMLDYAMEYDGPIAIKYSRGDAYKGLSEYNAPIINGKSEVIYNGSKVAILPCGNMMEEAVKLVDLLKQDDISPSLVNVRFVSSVDKDMLSEVMINHEIIVTMEENICKGGYGEMVAACISDMSIGDSIKHINVSIKKGSVEQGKISVLRRELGIDAESVYKLVRTEL